MRNFALATICLVLAGCGSTSNATLPQKTRCEDNYSNVWVAAQWAVNQLGFDVVNANNVGGSILGRMGAEVYGAEMEIDVSITENRGDRSPGEAEPMWLQVRVTSPNNPDPDEERREQMKMMEDRFLEILRQRAACAGRY